jgi:hydroxymethylpyrimidine/phosphomethylpyrimidine kinase
VALVVDPVMVAKGGHRLLLSEAEAALRDRLLPMAALLTPNLPRPRCWWGFRCGTRPTCGAPPRSWSRSAPRPS